MEIIGTLEICTALIWQIACFQKWHSLQSKFKTGLTCHNYIDKYRLNDTNNF